MGAVVLDLLDRHGERGRQGSLAEFKGETFDERISRISCIDYKLYRIIFPSL